MPEAVRDAGTPRLTAAAVGWGSAFALYTLGYAGAIQLSMGLGPGIGLLSGLANSLPDALAAPLVVRAAGRPAPGRRLVALAVPFVVWSVLGSSAGLAAMRSALEGAPWRLSLEPRGVAWKALFSILVFGVLAAVGLARAYSRQAREASARALRAETLRAEARLAILRAQLNPHFILNVLHSLVGLAERDPKATASALERLGTTLRYALRVQSGGSDRVALRDELAFTREYLELERMRLGARLTARVLADGAPLHRVVPPFVLQPLVENAVVHAIAPRAAGGIVSIRIAEEGDALLLVVEDDGAPEGVPSIGTGLGLKLLRDRVEALYGGQGRVEVDSSPLGGRRVTLRLVGEPGGAGEADRE